MLAPPLLIDLSQVLWYTLHQSYVCVFPWIILRNSVSIIIGRYEAGKVPRTEIFKTGNYDSTGNG